MKDSRERFEAFHRERMVEEGFCEKDVASEFDREECGEYVYPMAHDGWAYWQAAVEAVKEQRHD